MMYPSSSLVIGGIITRLPRLILGLFYLAMVDEPLPGLGGFLIIRPLDLPG